MTVWRCVFGVFNDELAERKGGYGNCDEPGGEGTVRMA